MSRSEQDHSPVKPVIEQLAALYGVQTRYRDSRGKWRAVPVASLGRLLQALGAELDPSAVSDEPQANAGDKGLAELQAALGARRRELRRRALEPVVVAWEGVLPPLGIRLDGDTITGGGGRRRGSAQLSLELEGGAATWSVDLDLQGLPASLRGNEPAASASRRPGLPGPGYVIPPRLFPRPAEAQGGASRGRTHRLPFGYHRLRLEGRAGVAESTIISAPRRCWEERGRQPQEESEVAAGALRAAPPPWGIFAPAYALRSARNLGAGDIGDLRRLSEEVSQAGGSVVATLPLLAAFLREPFEPAPYRPVSRLFWNEFYLAVDDIPEWEQCPEARHIGAAPGFQAALAALRADEFVDYGEAMALKRQVLEELTACFFATAGEERKGAFRAYLQARPESLRYAAFCEEVERRETEWRSWDDEGAGLRAAFETFSEGDLPSPEEVAGWSLVRRYHLYCQWQAEEQLGAIAQVPSSAGLLLDLPVGVHPGGYDTWSRPDLFVQPLSSGAPPDAFFSLGQDWSFPPLHPEWAREQGHEYYAGCLRHHMKHARFLRVDHVMGLHRMYVIPEGAAATEGAYLTYPAEELYAVLTLESERNQTVVVGEDLGTVPPGVRSSMARHGVLRTWVLQTSTRPRSVPPIAEIPAACLSSINTHDMVPFAGFLLGRDIEARVETGQLETAGAERERRARRELGRKLARFLLPASPLGGHQNAGDQVTGGEHDPTVDRAPTVEHDPTVDRAPTVEHAPTAEHDPGAAPHDPLGDWGQSDAERLLRSALAFIARSRTRLLLINLEDLLLEIEPQNLPGTGPERPNWRRKLRASPAEVTAAMAKVAGWLRR